ncbi:unnamed protein product [Schistocephalus solidus]|uniref:SBF2 domain-containing protein n=1 Tax=Schistocephalus solidus TaxID=70667 RepID=A0A183SQK8_SCHSO|nr:unnamed protein product [Schistocephalus solidus]
MSKVEQTYVKDPSIDLDFDTRYVDEIFCLTSNTTDIDGYGGLVLEQCNGSDDFSPACSLLNSAFRLFQQEVAPNGRVTQTFMYAGLRDQQIWQSTRFWNAAVFLALQQERSVQASATTGTENDLDLEKELHDALAFSQLSSKKGREMIETWACDENTVNRFIDLALACRALHDHLRTGATFV